MTARNNVENPLPINDQNKYPSKRPSKEAVTLPVGLNGEAARCTLTVNGEPYAAAVRGLFREDEDLSLIHI